MKTIKKKMGAPEKIGTIDLRQLETIARLGFTNPQIADFFHISRASINNYYKKDKNFLDAIKRGKETPDDEIEKSLFHRAHGYSCPETIVFNYKGEIVTHEVIKHYPPDTASMIFWLKNRRPDRWRDVIDNRHSGTIGFAQGENNNEAYKARMMEKTSGKKIVTTQEVPAHNRLG